MGLVFSSTFPRIEESLLASVFGAVPLSMPVLTMLISGASTVRHIRYFQGGPLPERLCGATRLPTWHALGR